MIGLSVNANNLADLKGLIAKFLSEVEGAPELTANVHINIDGANYGGSQTPAAPLKGEVIVPEKPAPKGKKVKDAAPAEPVQTDIEDVQPATHDDMVAALSKVNGDRGMQAVREIIAKFGAQKVGEVKAEDRAAVIAAAKAIIE